MLVKITDAYIFCPFDLSFIRREVSGHNIEKSRLSLPVGANEPDVLATQQPERDVRENRSVSEAVSQMLYSQNAHNNLLA